MILERFYDDKLAQASYLVGCAATGEALVVDPNRDVDQYIRAADARGLRITHITETHIHADFVSGARELADRSGGMLYLSDEGDADWKYRFAEESGATLVRDGDHFMVGNVRIEVLHTPGHTPEHLSFLVTDTAATNEPMGVFTGDFVFVGDVGRPDLLERAAKFEGTMEAGARQLYHSLTRFRSLPDHVQIWPGHGAGSACGKALGAVPMSTLGYEKTVNWAFGIESEDAFVQAVLEGQPEPPKYFAEMKRINKEGPRILHGFHPPERLPDSRVDEVLAKGAMVVDTRRWADFSEGHIPGTVNIPQSQSFTTWAGWLIPYDRDFYLIVDEAHSPTALGEAVRDLALIGLDRMAGYFDVQAVDDWTQDGVRELESIPELTAQDVAAKVASGEATLVDVRGLSEWEAAHVPGVTHIPLGYLSDRIDELDSSRPVILQCQGGARSAIGASVLQSRGFKNVINQRGGFGHWQAIGLEVEHGAGAAV